MGILQEPYMYKKFNEIDSSLGENANKTRNIITVEKYGGNTLNSDNSTAIQSAIDAVYAMGGGDVLLMNGTLNYATTLQLKDKVRLVGFAGDVTASTLKFNGTGYAIITVGNHLRQRLKDFNLKVTSNATGGIRIGDVVANLDRDNGILPRQIDLDNIIIQDLITGQYGIRMQNASAITMKKVRSGYGSGGIGLSIECDGYNSGVFNADECSFGRVNSLDIGLQFVGGSGGLDGYTFNGCYFGGVTPIKLYGDSAPRNIVFNAPHIEPTVGASEVYCFDVNNAQGLIVNAGQLDGFSASNVIGFLFRNQCYGVVVNGVDCNEFKGTVYKSLGTSNRNSILTEASTSGDCTGITQFTGDFQYVGRFGGRFKIDYVEAKYLCSQSGNKIDWGSVIPTSDGTLLSWTRGDYRHNSAPNELGTAGSKYVIIGWKCISSGTAGTWVECRGLTGN